MGKPLLFVGKLWKIITFNVKTVEKSSIVPWTTMENTHFNGKTVDFFFANGKTMENKWRFNGFTMV